MNPQIKKYYAVVVHFGPSRVTNQTINALLEQSQGPDEIIVVNNNSSPYQPTADSKVKVINPQTNQGYAAGLNVALGYLLTSGANGHDVIMFMNNDISFSPNFFAQLRRQWTDLAPQSLVGAQFNEGKNRVIKNSYVNLLTGRTHLYSKHGPSKPWHLPYLHGAFIAADYRTILQVPGWPDQYFLYWEDVALAARARRRAINLKLLTDLSVNHPKDEATPTDQQLYYLVRNGALFLTQETSWPWRIYWHIANPLRWVYHHLNPNTKPTVRAALTDAILHKTGPRLR